VAKTTSGFNFIKIAVQQPLYKLTIGITYWLLPNNMELIDTRRQVDTNMTGHKKVIMKNMHCLTPKVSVTRTVPERFEGSEQSKDAQDAEDTRTGGGCE